jgi:hypothetical protein
MVVLGGRFTLLKFVLESQPVYWMSLAVIPCSVLNTLRKMMFNFLWKGNNESNHFHLCKWEQFHYQSYLVAGVYEISLTLKSFGRELTLESFNE